MHIIATIFSSSQFLLFDCSTDLTNRNTSFLRANTLRKSFHRSLPLHNSSGLAFIMSSIISHAQDTYKVAWVRPVNAVVPTAGWLLLPPARMWNLPCPGISSSPARTWNPPRPRIGWNLLRQFIPPAPATCTRSCSISHRFFSCHTQQPRPPLASPLHPLGSPRLTRS